MADHVGRIAPFIRRHLWMVASVVTAVVVAVVASWPTIGVILLAAYALLNSFGVAIFCDGLRHRRAPLQLTLKLLAVVLVPVGLVTALLKPGGLTPSETSTAGSPDDRIRRASSFAPPQGLVGRGGGGGAC